MAGADHQAALGEEQRRAERDLVRAEQGGDDDVAPGLEAAVDAHAHAAAQAVATSACCVSASPSSHGSPAFLIDESGLAPVPPSQPATWTTSASAFATPTATTPTPASATSFTDTAAAGCACSEVEDELREVLDRVDVVVRRRRDQRDAGLGVPEPRDLLAHLRGRELTALAGLRALRDLDLELVREGEVLGRDAEAAGGDLLDARVSLVAEARGILAALAGVRAGAEPVERDRDRLVRLGRERAVRHRAAREAADDRLDRLDLVERHGLHGGHELEQVAQLHRLAAVHELGEACVVARAAVRAACERRDDVRVRRVRLAALAELDVAGVLELRLVAPARSAHASRSSSAKPTPPTPTASGEAGRPRRGRARASKSCAPRYEATSEIPIFDMIFSTPSSSAARNRRCASAGDGMVAAELVRGRELRDRLEREPRADRVGAVAEQAGAAHARLATSSATTTSEHAFAGPRATSRRWTAP